MTEGKIPVPQKCPWLCDSMYNFSEDRDLEGLSGRCEMLLSIQIVIAVRL